MGVKHRSSTEKYLGIEAMLAHSSLALNNRFLEQAEQYTTLHDSALKLYPTQTHSVHGSITGTGIFNTGFSKFLSNVTFSTREEQTCSFSLTGMCDSEKVVAI